MPDYYPMPGWEQAGPDGLRLPHSRSLLAAVTASREFKLLECLRLEQHEALVVEVTCPEVPNRNANGIKTRERAAIVMQPGEKAPPSVVMLRTDFPEVMHVHGVPQGAPCEPCLYFEPTRAVMRTWTAPRFLQRIQWWLTGAAAGTLHAADQPLELPFFNAGSELVLPADFEQLRSNPNQLFALRPAGPKRANGAATYRVGPAASAAEATWAFSVVRCPALDHQRTVHIPRTLGGLHDQLQPRGIDLLGLLRAQLLQRLADSGEAKTSESDGYILMIEFPVARQPGAVVERSQRLAFALAAGKLELGLRTGAYVEHEDRVYRFSPVAGALPHETDWQSLAIDPLSLLEAPFAQQLRFYSGIDSEGPSRAVLVGAGALGGAILDLVARNGWGIWSVIDGDHIKPHNLARHRAGDAAIGQPKAVFAQQLAACVTTPATVREAVVADACDNHNEQVRQLLDTADLVLDCSTTLDFPRLAALSPAPARHASAFVTPSGRDAVLLLEDAARHVRLNSLEAQYYRAVIARPWGKTHLSGNLSQFWSGASCRDLSARIDYGSVLGHAATIEHNLRCLFATSAAHIRVWCREPQTGATQCHQVPVAAATEHRIDGLCIRVDEGLLRRIRAMRKQYLPRETGGILVGFFDLNLRELVLVDAYGPPPDSSHSCSHFIRGVEGVQQAVDEAQRRTAGVVTYVGEWHSHPPGHRARPSRDDDEQIEGLSRTMAQDGLPVLQLIVGEGEETFRLRGQVQR